MSCNYEKSLVLLYINNCILYIDFIIFQYYFRCVNIILRSLIDSLCFQILGLWLAGQPSVWNDTMKLKHLRPWKYDGAKVDFWVVTLINVLEGFEQDSQLRLTKPLLSIEARGLSIECWGAVLLKKGRPFKACFDLVASCVPLV